MKLKFTYFSLSNLYMILFFTISIFLVWIYRGNLGDLGIISDAGEKILKRVNPYAESEFANSPLTAVLIHLISQVFPSTIFSTLIQIANIIGIVVFVKYIHSYFKLPDQSGLILLILALTISYRALISNVQLTGILLALFVLSQKLVSKPGREQKYLGYAAILLAFELKPQIVLPLLLITFVSKRDYCVKFLAILTSVAGHAIVNIHYDSLLERLWIEKITAFSNKSFLAGPEISLWKTLAYFSGALDFTKIVSSVVLISFYLVLVVLIFKNPERAFIFSLAAPFVGSYSHMYDLLGLLVAFLALNMRNPALNIPIILLLSIPFHSEPIMLFCASFLLMIFLWLNNTKTVKHFEISYATWTSISIAIIVATNYLITSDQELSLSIRLGLLVVSFGVLSKFIRRNA